MTAATALPPLEAQTGSPVFELRVYHVNEGKLPALLARFRDHTAALFTRHGITNIAYWLPTDDGPLKDRTLFYILKYPSREEATTRWKAFQTDPEWIKVRDASEVNGKLVDHVESTFLALTDFSPHL
jgi:NIPSNAP